MILKIFILFISIFSSKNFNVNLIDYYNNQDYFDYKNFKIKKNSTLLEEWIIITTSFKHLLKEKTLTNYKNLRKNYNFITDYTITGPYPIPSTAIFDFTPNFLSKLPKPNSIFFYDKKSIKTWLYNIDIPFSYNNNGYYLIETYCKSDKNIDDIILRFTTNGSTHISINNKTIFKTKDSRFRYHKINFLKKIDKIFKLSIITKIIFSKKIFISFKGVTCTSTKSKNLIENINIKNFNLQNISIEKFAKPNPKKEIVSILKEIEGYYNHFLYPQTLKLLKTIHKKYRSYLTFKKLLIFYWDNRLLSEFKNLYSKFIIKYQPRDDFELLSIIKKVDNSNYLKIIKDISKTGLINFFNIDKDIKEDKIPKLKYLNTLNKKVYDENIITFKEIVLTKKYIYKNYHFFIKNSNNFFNNFTIPSESEIIHIFYIKDGKIIPTNSANIDNDQLIKQIPNNTYLQIIYRYSLDNIENNPLFIKERFFNIIQFQFFSTNNILKILKINFSKLKIFKQKYSKDIFSFKIRNIPKFIDNPYSPLPYIYSPYLKFYKSDQIFYKKIDQKYKIKYKNYNSKIPNKVNSLKSLYYKLNSFKNLSKKFKILLTYLAKNKIDYQILNFSSHKDISKRDIFDYTIIYIPSKNIYLDINFPYIEYGKLPSYLDKQPYLIFDQYGNSLYKVFKQPKNTKFKNNSVKIDFKLSKNLDWMSGSITISIRNNFKNFFLNILKRYNEEELGYLLEGYLEDKIPESKLTNYEIYNENSNQKPLIIKLWVDTDTPTIFFEKDFEEKLILKNFFTKYWIDLIIQNPSIEKYATLKKRTAPIKTFYYIEDVDIKVKIDGENYGFTPFKRVKKIRKFQNYIHILETEITSKIFSYSYKLTIPLKLVKLKDYPQFYDFIKKITIDRKFLKSKIFINYSKNFD